MDHPRMIQNLYIYIIFLCANVLKVHSENENTLEIQTRRSPLGENARKELCENDFKKKIDQLYSNYYRYEPKHSHKGENMASETLETLEPNENAHGKDLIEVCTKKKEIDGVTKENEKRLGKKNDRLEVLEKIGNDLDTPDLEFEKLVKLSVPKTSFPNCKNILEFEPLVSEIYT